MMIDVKPEALRHLQLADEQFAKRQDIDFILGIPEVTRLIKGKIKKLSDNIVAIGSRLGYLVCGISSDGENKSPQAYLAQEDQDTAWDRKMRMFWGVDAPEAEEDENMKCEAHFLQTVKRQHDGRFEVNILRKDLELGNSSVMALSRFYNQKRSFEKNPTKKLMYQQAMQEMIDSKYLEKVEWNQVKNFIPHSAVIKEESLSTKCRVVFDAAAKCSSGRSFNNILYCGKKLQPDICIVLARFRRYPWVFGADISKMYLQIAVDDESALWQGIVWQLPGEKVESYVSKRLVFGLKISPYLALRTLQMLADEDGGNFSKGADIIKHQMYIDDVLASYPTVSDAQDALTQITQLLGKGKFPLSKYFSNSAEVISTVAKNKRLDIITKDLGGDNTVKTLRFRYDYNSDRLTFKIHLGKPVKLTKRTILSEVMKIYDPTGLVESVIFSLKLILRDLWTQQLDWDKPVPEEIGQRYEQFRSEIPL